MCPTVRHATEVITRTYSSDGTPVVTGFWWLKQSPSDDVTPLQPVTLPAVTIECITDLPATDITVVTDEADNCGTPVVAFVSDVSNGASCPEVITRTYSVTDSCDNRILVTQTITIDDITNPTASNRLP